MAFKIGMPKQGDSNFALIHTYPVKYCQMNTHVERSVSKVNPLRAINENDIVEGFHSVGVTTLEIEKYRTSH